MEKLVPDAMRIACEMIVDLEEAKERLEKVATIAEVLGVAKDLISSMGANVLEASAFVNVPLADAQVWGKELQELLEGDATRPLNPSLASFIVDIG